MNEFAPARRPEETEDLLRRFFQHDDQKGLVARLDFMAQTTAEDIGAERLVISLFYQAQACLVGLYPPEPVDTSHRVRSLRNSFGQFVIRRKAAINLADLHEDQEVVKLAERCREGFRGLLGVPIETPEHGIVGAVFALSRGVRQWRGLEQKYIEQIARSVAYTLEAELSMAEQRHLFEEISDLDRIVTTLAADLAVPTSIYTESGELAFANVALSSLVPLGYVSEFRADLAWQESNTGHSANLFEVPSEIGPPGWFRVSCTTSSSGMMVCHWLPDPVVLS